MGVRKDKDLEVEEIESSLTQRGSGEGRVQGRGKWRGCRYYSGVSVGVRQTQII